MKQCRTQASPKMQVQCTGMRAAELVPHSCGHRHCPHCQHHESQQWLERQLKKQVPAEYFLLTFTLPARIPGAGLGAPGRALRSAACAAPGRRCAPSAGTTGNFGAPRRHRGVAYEHPRGWTITRTSIWSCRRRRSTPSEAVAHQAPRQGKAGYLFNHKALAKVFRAKMLAAIEAAGLDPARALSGQVGGGLQIRRQRRAGARSIWAAICTAA